MTVIQTTGSNDLEIESRALAVEGNPDTPSAGCTQDGAHSELRGTGVCAKKSVLPLSKPRASSTSKLYVGAIDSGQHL